MSEDFNSGFDELSSLLAQYSESTEKVTSALTEGARAMVEDLKKLPKPKSKIFKPGYTHLVDSFTFRRQAREVEVGWGKYYGPMLERGTITMMPKTHLRPVWEQNKDKYHAIMIKALGLGKEG